MTEPLIILASNSPRRRELLSWLGLEFVVTPANVDENPFMGENPRQYVLRLAQSKACAAAAQSPAGVLVLAADTIVVDGDEILGKPVDSADARRMLKQLCGRVHQVYTAIALIHKLERPKIGPPVLDEQPWLDACLAEVPMREYSNIEIEKYIASGDPMDKAGAYAIQNPGFQPVVDFKGCYACVMGLPLCHVGRILRKTEMEIQVDIPAVCQKNLSYHCPVFAGILQEVEGSEGDKNL